MAALTKPQNGGKGEVTPTQYRHALQAAAKCRMILPDVLATIEGALKCGDPMIAIAAARVWAQVAGKYEDIIRDANATEDEAEGASEVVVISREDAVSRARRLISGGRDSE